jgi:DNA excision repair protein ERCC-3
MAVHLRWSKALTHKHAVGDLQAHSSILVLPCGAGKTLVGITVSSIIKKCILVFCTSMMAVNQWREQFLKWSDIEPNRISRFISDTRKKGEWDHTCGLLITTYNMFTSEKRYACTAISFSFLQANTLTHV